MEIYEDSPNNYSHTANSVTIVYNVVDAGGVSDDDVRTAVLMTAPWTYVPALGNQIPWIRKGYSQKELGPGTWKAEITYSFPNQIYAFEYSGSQQHVRQAKATIRTYGSNPGDHKGAVGYDGRTVHGCKIFVPSASWTETYEIPSFWFVNNVLYENNLYYVLNNPVNANPFRGKQAHSVLFMGCTGALSTGNPELFSLSFKFSYEPNRTAVNGNPITIGDFTVEKDGWDYVDVFYEPTQDTTAFRMVPKPQSVRIQRMYDYGDFAFLNIGTGLNRRWGG